MAQHGESLSKDLTPQEFKRFRDYIHQHSGIYLEEQKTDSLRISLITRATRFSFPSLDEYFKLLTTDEDEFKELLNLVTINETSFFRFPQQFEAMRKFVIPEIIESKSVSNKQFRVWSAGCSTGEEPYTIAMTLLDSGIEGLGYRMEVLGTDVSTNALMRAKDAVYPSRALHNIPQSVSSRFFEATPKGHRVSERARKLVTLQYHNLIQEPYPLALMGNWDIIFCRNVTIYFRLDSTRRVVQNYYDSLNPGGYLFIGHSETLTSISDKFEPVEVGGVFLYRKSKHKTFAFNDVLQERERERRQARSRRAGEPSTGTRRSTSSPQRPQRTLVPSARAAAADAAREPEVDVREMLDVAIAAARAGEPAAVLAAVERVLSEDSDCAEAYLLAAHAHADTGNLDAAFGECHKALAIDPLLAGARYVLGMIHLRRGEHMEALSEFKRTIYTDSGFVLAHLNLANLYRAQGAMEDACREYELTLRTLYENPEGEWIDFMGGFKSDLLAKTVERSLIECRKSV